MVEEGIWKDIGRKYFRNCFEEQLYICTYVYYIYIIKIVYFILHFGQPLAEHNTLYRKKIISTCYYSSAVVLIFKRITVNNDSSEVIMRLAIVLLPT